VADQDTFGADVADASHELRTPLGLLTTELELALLDVAEQFGSVTPSTP
jgi:signal transduction histidine kinase